MDPHRITMFLCGDVMTGRGVDQILPHPSEPHIFEPHLRDAREYVWLAEQANGPVPQPASFAYVWGEALAELERRKPDARIVNLETTITRNANPWRNKDVHYRMHPANIACLSDARVDVCVLANNHTLDYGRAGLVETLEVLRDTRIEVAGAGRTLEAARAPASLSLASGGRLLVFAFASPTSGVPPEWAATEARPGLDYLRSLSSGTARAIVERIRQTRTPGDLVVVSLHWGSNWGWEVDDQQVRFAHQLIDGGVDLVYGHSSHHPRPIEVYQGRLILYGCGDFIDDYEGISGHEEFRDDLRLMYFATLSASTGALEALEIVPLRVRRMTLERASTDDRVWLSGRLDRIGQPFASEFEARNEGLRLRVRPPARQEVRMKVKSVMTSPVETIGAGKRVEAAARQLRDANIGILPVIEHDQVIGVVTDRDLVVRVLAEGRDVKTTCVCDVMTGGVVTCSEEDDVSTAAALMVRKAIRRLVVLAPDGRPAGVVSVDDVAHLGAEEGAPALIGTSEPVSPVIDPR